MEIEIMTRKDVENRSREGEETEMMKATVYSLWNMVSPELFHLCSTSKEGRN
jgi:hypothetical protein